MITHIVLLRIGREVPQAKIDAVFAALADLRGRIPGLLSFSGGAYTSPEGLNRGFTHGFVMTFADAASRDAYLPHPHHEVVKAIVLKVLDGGLDGVVAFDYAS
ncbi:MAG: Dabb family protein [Planctomycetes bacterium]|nr:Dabb family protein [Planctomycetota bacterium]